MIKAIPLCSRCTFHEINSWINEKREKINDDTAHEINQELTVIKLKQGECIVCQEKKISDNCFFKILNILEKNKNSQEMKKEFVRLFGITENF